jgi:hypothetical protein
LEALVEFDDSPFVSFHLQVRAVGGIPHETSQRQRLRQPKHKRTKSDTLNGAEDADAATGDRHKSHGNGE